ncbi:MAG: NAD-dependent epimerase/dehydratase [Berkelbacteria bacterium GW2011_GWA1_36_9]|uniref:NAD-dependent epimerase/dehydratase n=1 Tax=Berkelbacteria bacterium GW2011_GWA1_36_9 TaxID=1618331 RepID=A0A0G0IRX1_9BACT|nr:MAG: NAD-dependent epimerase/dehydratase [Berkelbacteria bacterium GW2011_GWA1_36_9]
MSKILITGASGFIGQHLFRRLKKEGFSVFGISRTGGYIDDQKIFSLDLQNKEEVNNFLKNKKIDCIIHLAALVPQSFNDQTAYESLYENFVSTFNLLEVLKQDQIKKFVFASSMSVIGQPPKKSLDENIPVEPTNFYSLSKYFGEKMSQLFGLKFKKKVIILRISAPYGQGQKEGSVIPLFINQALKSENLIVLGQGKRLQDFIYISDIVEAFVCAIKYPACGIYNLASGQSTNTYKLAKIILKLIPESHSKIILKGIDTQEKYQLRVNISKAKKDLKYIPKVLIKDGIGNYINYLKRQK